MPPTDPGLGLGDEPRRDLDPSLTEEAAHPGLGQGERQTAGPALGRLALLRPGGARHVKRALPLRCVEPLELRGDGIEYVGLAQHPQRVERQYAGGPFPDRQHLRIAQQAG